MPFNIKSLAAGALIVLAVTAPATSGYAQYTGAPGAVFAMTNRARNLTIHQFPLRTVDGWSPRVMQGFRVFSEAGSTDGWNEWDCCLGGRDQG